MFTLKSGTSGYTAEVDSQNRVQAFSTSRTESTARAVSGDGFNINTGNITLTSDNQSALLYLENIDTVDWIVRRVFYNISESTGGAGDMLANVVANSTGGTIISSGVDFDPVNFNFGSAKTLTSICKRGAEGLTATGGIQEAVSTLIPSAGVRILISFDSVILKPGSSMAINVTPPASNTSMKIQVGVNVHRGDE